MRKTLFQVLLTMAVALAWVYELSQSSWVSIPIQHVIVLILVISFLQRSSKKSVGRMNYSLATAFSLAVLFNFGPLLAMTLNPVTHFLTDLSHKKPLYAAFFNFCQLSFSTFLGAMVFRLLGGTVGILELPTDFPLLLLSALTYAFVNLGIVTYFISLDRKIPWIKVLKDLNTWVLLSFFVSIYAGILYAFMTQSHGILGFALFSVFIVLFSELLQSGISYSAERQRRELAEKELLMDAKTDTYNFRFLNEWLAKKDHTPVSMIFLDIDDFKRINDEQGHEKGDEVLQKVAASLKENTGDDGFVVRYGGEEFIVILPFFNKQQALEKSERLRRALAESSLVTVTASFGVASFPDSAKDRRELIYQADHSMYKAKVLGKNQCYLYRHEGPPKKDYPRDRSS